MTSSITAYTQSFMPQSFKREATNNDNRLNGLNNNQATEQTNAVSSEKNMFSKLITQVKKADLEAMYNDIKISVKNELNAKNIEQQKLEVFDYLEGNIDEIMHHDIEVKVERDEVYKAIIYNRMGINYLELKELETKIGLLDTAKEDVVSNEKSGIIRKDESQQLHKQIEDHQAKLEQQKQDLLDSKKFKESELRFFEQLTMDLAHSQTN